jgi:hypothetical protein
MKPVVQLERTGCGIASVAALAGVSYAQAKRVANRLGIFADDPKLWSETDYVRRLLKEYGIRSASPELPVTSWKALPDIALLAVKWHKEGDRAFWHWVVFWRGPSGTVVLDSNRALRTQIRTDFGRMKPKWFIGIEASTRRRSGTPSSPTSRLAGPTRSQTPSNASKTKTGAVARL